jgi:hypothetical protein
MIRKAQHGVHAALPTSFISSNVLLPPYSSPKTRVLKGYPDLRCTTVAFIQSTPPSSNVELSSIAHRRVQRLPRGANTIQRGIQPEQSVSKTTCISGGHSELPVGEFHLSPSVPALNARRRVLKSIFKHPITNLSLRPRSQRRR